LFLMVQDFASMAFHGLALWFLFSGFRASQRVAAGRVSPPASEQKAA
jgi:hypothetical protein